MKVYKFNDCYLNATERRIFKSGRLIDFTPRVFDVLLLLVENAGIVVTKNELIREVWSDSFIEEGNIPVHISKLRKLLDATKADPFIETVSGVGYRFVSRVEIVSEEDWKKAVSESKKAPHRSESENQKIDSIAVLPFENVAQTPELDYLAEGLTESIINNLSYLPEIRVIARNTVFRFKNIQPTQALEVGATLDVSVVLTGRVRVIGTNVIIGVELIKISDGSQLWGKQYNQPFSDIFEIQETIARSISEILRAKITDFAHKSIHRQSPQNARAFALYLKGRHFWAKKNVEDINHAIKFFQESIAADPYYSASYVGMADCYISLYQNEKLAREETSTYIYSLLNKIAKFDKHSSESLAILGHAKSQLEWDIKAADNYFRESLALNPNNAITLHKYANLLNFQGRLEESLSYHWHALAFDPLSTAINASLGRLFYISEQFDSAITQLLETLELDTENLLTLLLLSVSLAAKGRFIKSLEILHSIPSDKRNFETLSMIGYVQALSGQTEDARQTIERLTKLSKVENVDPINLAYIYTALGRIDEAFEYLEKAFLYHSNDLIAIKIDPRFKPLRIDSRFHNLVQRIGLDDSNNTGVITP